ncbi:AAA family ATPase [Protaetiibacter sp. SSC-01]|uniref:ATP-dependent DNA helicase n=1 Tax=Protaetiibacter sp. SSC-01 TaxID=2759943 RepID=UPI001656BD2F|nr:ATP-dependent RecD-like DNA helicase [Protaetiibacter sp. SSC-01]QNO38663.1 AAA family ATPase [Protaetiibacter sp. SSC-01]
MASVDSQILNASATISENIEVLASNRSLLSRNVLKQLRDLTEGVIVRMHLRDGSAEFSQDAIEAATSWVGSASKKVNFLHRFHKLLQMSESHYTFEGDISERLMLKYYEYLLRIRTLLHDECGIDVLDNLEKFPVDLDPSLREYHEKIAERIDAVGLTPPDAAKEDHYYVRAVRPFITGGRVFYEVTFSHITDRPNKFDRIIAFTDIDMTSRYAANLRLESDEIEVLGRRMPIIIIRGWKVAIRPCELNHFAEILGMSTSDSRTVEYHALMQYLTDTGASLLDLVDMPDALYEHIKARATASAKPPRIFPAFDKARAIIRAKAPGTNVLRYLLLEMNNRIIKLQQDGLPNRYLSSLHLTSSARPFDTMPFAAAPRGHVPRMADLLECIDTTGREHELLAKRIKTNVERHGMLYTPAADLGSFGALEDLIATHNRTIPPTPSHAGRVLEMDRDHVFMHEYEDGTVAIIEKLQALATEGVDGWEVSVERWLDETPLKIDDEVKKAALRALFASSRVALIYGAAGTGKSTMVNYIANYFGENSKLFLAHTNPAKANLERRVTAQQNAEFRTISSQIGRTGPQPNYDVLVIDECSTVSNSDLLKVLDNTDFKLLVLVGDVFQIEAIQFGNWFSIAPNFLPRGSSFELTKPWRTDDRSLLDFWAKVRGLEEGIDEVLAHYGYSGVLDESLFAPKRDDEIILCLNYDGLYGINNINRFLQAGNPGKAATWGAATYKVGDPVLFGESGRFHPLIHNNLKGRIADVEAFADRIQFDIWLDRRVTELDVWAYEGLEYVGDSTVRFSVVPRANTDQDNEDLGSIVPFQVAYAVSIHKSQGLEYDSVKVVITDANEDDITHAIFYTAITRARESLTIYWTPETQRAVLSGLKRVGNGRDVGLLKARRGLKRIGAGSGAQ